MNIESLMNCLIRDCFTYDYENLSFEKVPHNVKQEWDIVPHFYLLSALTSLRKLPKYSALGAAMPLGRMHKNKRLLINKKNTE